MIKSTGIAALVATLVTSSIAWADDDTASDIKRLQGEWKYVEVEIDGKEVSFDTHPVWKERRWIVNEMEITVTPGKAGLGNQKKTLKLDTSQSPKALDMTSLDGNENGITQACIYSFEKDRLKICIPYFLNRVDPSKRPSEFKTQDGDGLMLLVLELAKAN